MSELTKAQRELLERLESGAHIVHAQDNERAWLYPFAAEPEWNDLDWKLLGEVRAAGWIDDNPDHEDDTRFPPAEIITLAGRSALGEKGS